jgi:hypothetical protein
VLSKPGEVSLTICDEFDFDEDEFEEVVKEVSMISEASDGKRSFKLVNPVFVSSKSTFSVSEMVFTNQIDNGSCS